jgi:hypothetical protein
MKKSDRINAEHQKAKEQGERARARQAKQASQQLSQEVGDNNQNQYR